MCVRPYELLLVVRLSALLVVPGIIIQEDVAEEDPRVMSLGHRSKWHLVAADENPTTGVDVHVGVQEWWGDIYT